MACKRNVDPTTGEVVKKEGRNIYYVSARKDENNKVVGWEVKRENCERVTAFCETKEIALAKVKELASNSQATVIIRKVDGSIQDTIKYGENKR